MFFRTIDAKSQVALTVPRHAQELFALTVQNREYLQVWLPWLDAVKDVSDTKRFIESNLESFAKGTALHEVLLYQGGIAGVLGFNRIDKASGIGHIGYWLGAAFTGRGLMTSAVADLIRLGFQDLGLQRVEIRCATQNVRSRAIPERLGFHHEGTLRNVERVGENLFSHAIYGLLCTELQDKRRAPR
ncbi:GNAT family N-acetyltransferase [Halomonas sp. WWR20]